MNQVYITAISLQAPKNLTKVLYEPVDLKYQKNKETSFPIIPVIMNTVWENTDASYIIVIRPENVDTDQNFETLKEELRAVNIQEKNIIDLPLKGDSGRKESLGLLLKLIDKIPDDSIIYSDITYNTKPMSAMVLYAMQMIEKIKDTEVTGIFYGELLREGGRPTGEARLYDITSFKYLADMTSNLEDLGFKDIRAALARMIE